MATAKLNKDDTKLILELDEAETKQVFSALVSVLGLPNEQFVFYQMPDVLTHLIWCLCQDFD